MKVKELSMFVTLSVAASKACCIGSKDRHVFDVLMSLFKQYWDSYRSVHEREIVREEKSNCNGLPEEVEVVNDPHAASTKEAQRKSQSILRRKKMLNLQTIWTQFTKIQVEEQVTFVQSEEGNPSRR